MTKQVENLRMIYRIVWKKNGQFYTEYKDIEETKSILDFLEKNIDNGFELVNITPNALL